MLKSEVFEDRRSVRRALLFVALTVASLFMAPAVANATGGTVHYPSGACGSGYKLVQIDTKNEASLQRYYNGAAASGRKNCTLLVARGSNYGATNQDLEVRLPNDFDRGPYRYYAGPVYGCGAARGTWIRGFQQGTIEDGYFLSNRC